MRDNLGNADREKKQDMQGKPVHGFFYHLFGILKAVALIIIFLIAASAALHQTMTVWEKGRTPPAGDLVTADGHKMSIYVTGRGENTIVLLPGLGTAAPILDFMPLAQALARETGLWLWSLWGMAGAIPQKKPVRLKIRWRSFGAL